MRLKDIVETFKKDLQDPEFVQVYLQDALNDGLPSFLIALSDVAKANQGMARLAEESSITRESLYRTLSENGNPQFSTIEKVLHSLGMQFSITPIQQNLSKEFLPTEHRE
jgi:probable addiction module antidote protein